MAIHVHCPFCGEELHDVTPECAHCGASLPPGVLYAVSAALGKVHVTSMPMAAGPPPHLTSQRAAEPSPAAQACSPAANSALRPWLAAALSVVCGLGQLYNGQMKKGVVLLLLGAVSVVTFPLLLGKLLAPLVWLYAIIDAYLVARHTRPLPR